MLKDLRASKRAYYLILGAIFVFMLIMNLLTAKVADDYMYSFNLDTGERLATLDDMIASAIHNGKYANGRYFAHFFAFLFLMLPDIIFDVVNTSVFVASLLMIYKIANGKSETDNALLIGIFGFIFLFVHDFGQVCLWLDGSCNYNFAVFFGLLYIIPFINLLENEKPIHPALILPHMLLSVLLGGYNEPLSVGFVFAAGLMFLTELFYYKKLRALWFVPSLLSSVFGLAIMAFAPGETTNKLSTFSFENLLMTFGMALLMLASIFPIIIIFVLCFLRARREGADTRVLLTALIIAAGALASDFVLVLASIYPPRCSTSLVFMAITATAFIFGRLKSREVGARAIKWCKVFTVALCLALTLGLADNVVTRIQHADNENIIAEAKENGKSEVEIYRPLPFTKYNAVWGLIYLDVVNPEGWPNNYMADYYEIDVISGRSYLKDWFNLYFGW